MSVIFVTDNSSDINEKLAETLRLKVKLLFCPLWWPEGEKLEGEDIYEKMRKSKTLPKTATVSTGEYKKVFEEILEKGDEVICITPSPKISACINSAMLARSVLPKIYQERVYVLDSKTGLGGLGLLVLKGVSLAKEGRGVKEIIAILKENYIPHTLVAGFLESMKWVEAGGRISHGLALLSEQLALLKIKPIIGIVGGEGKLKPLGVKIGVTHFSKALFDFFEKKIGKEGLEREKFDVFISYTDNLSEARELENLLRRTNQVQEIYLVKLNPTVGCHTGPGSLFLSWLKN